MSVLVASVFLKRIHSNKSNILNNFSFYNIYKRPFQDLVRTDDKEFLKLDTTSEINELLRPFLMNINQQEILMMHNSKSDFISSLWRDYYDQNDCYQYWAYGIPEVINEYKKIGGEFAPYAWILGVLATLCSKEFVSYNGFKEFYVILFLCELTRRVWGDKIYNHLMNKEAFRAESTQKILDEPAKVYSKIVKSFQEERNYEYVKLMLANYDNDIKTMEAEIQYRTHLKTKYDEFIKRLNYQVEITQLKKYYESLLLRAWLLPQVAISITPAVKDKVLDECLSILKLKADAQTKQ